MQKFVNKIDGHMCQTIHLFHRSTEVLDTYQSILGPISHYVLILVGTSIELGGAFDKWLAKRLNG